MKKNMRSSYRSAARITRKASSTFWLATMLFDLDTRRSLQALYAYCRVADDIGDSLELSNATKINKLRLMRQALHSKRPVAVAANIWPAIFDTIRQHKLPVGEMEIVLRGIASDITFHQPTTYSDLDKYSYQVAGVVGVLSARVLGAYKPSTLEAAKQLGIAMQYTNIIRDVSEDQKLGRIYLPQALMRSHSLSPAQFSAGHNSAGLTATLAAMAIRAETFYDHAAPAIADLHPSYQKPVIVAFELYHAILDRIKQKQYNVLAGQVRLDWNEKLALVWRVYTGRYNFYGSNPKSSRNS